MDVTRFVLEFRECARHVWNVYFQPHEDGWHEFINVERALFSGLVLSRIELPEGQWVEHPDGYYPAIGLVPHPAPRGQPILVAEELREGVVEWKEQTLSSAEVDLRFIGFFDFADMNAVQDFRYARARVLRSAQPGLAGKDLLIDALAVNFEGRAD